MDESQHGQVRWQAPSNPRWQFGNTRALFKMYFTSEMRDPKETTEDGPCARFAREFLPIVNDALAQVYSGSAASVSSGGEDAAGTKEAEPAPTEAAETPS
jgi:hypothetical protein